MWKNRLLAIAGGAVSAAFALSVFGGAFGALAVVFFAPLPLLLVGMCLGLSGTIIASIVAFAAVAAAVTTEFALGYALRVAIPAIAIIWLALRKRQLPDGTDAWPEAGAVLGWVSLGGLAVVAYAVPFGDSAAVEGKVSAFFEGLLQSVAVPDPDREARIAALAKIVAYWYPGMMVAGGIGLITLNAIFAQWMAVQLGRNIRPSPAYSQTELPFWLEVAALACLALAVFPGTAGRLGQNGLIALATPFYFVGLAVIHSVSRSWPGRPFALFGLYFLTLLFNWLALAVAVLGFVEPIVGLRRRAANRGQDQEDE